MPSITQRRPCWHAQYPGLFDENDLRLALSQTRGHYFEWKAAIHYFAAGYVSLIEKYELARSHATKYEIFNERLGPAAGELVAELVELPIEVVDKKRALRACFG
ncbi:MAG TPA: hypothetical protein VGQ98_00090 [Gemmatimonadaceae bacterium]|nr:hypothetical protein [Gemmatimonadaceae bacterium]